MPSDPDDILAFWRAAGPDKWFEKDDALDAEIRERFRDTYAAAAAGRLAAWEENAEGALALVIVLDQFPRNMFRGDARTYAADPLARAVAERAIARGFHQRCAPLERRFFYLPLMHSEDLADQERCLALCRAAGDEEGVKYGEIHADIIRRFGTATGPWAVPPRPRSRPFSTPAASPDNIAIDSAEVLPFDGLFRRPTQPNVKAFALDRTHAPGRTFENAPWGAGRAMSVIGSHEGSGAFARLAPAALYGRARAWLADHSDHRRAQRTAGNAFLIRVASAVLVYAIQVLLARWMGEFQFGIYVYVWTWVLLIGALVDFGLASAAQRFIPEYLGLRAFALLRGFLSGSRWLTLAIATAIAALAALGIRVLEPWIGQYEIVPLYLACATLPMFALTHMQEGIARAYGWVNIALLPPYIVRSLVLVAAMGAARVLGFATDAVTAMTAAVIATWATTVVQLVMLERRLGGAVAPGPKAYEAGAWLLTAIPIFMVEGFYFLLTYADVLVLQQFRPPEEVAIYYAAAKTLALVTFVHYSVAAATTHKFTEYHVRGDRARLAAFLSESIRWTFWPSLAATIVILALGRPFLWLFGPRFVDGYSLMFILAVGPLARSAIGPVERLLNMVGEQRACALVYGGAFAFNFVGCLVLIPPLGIHGAAIATAAAVLFESVLLFFVTKRRLGLHVFIWKPRVSGE